MSEPIEAATRIGVTRAREAWSSVMDEVLAGRLRVLERRRDAVALVRADQLERLLALAFPFAPEVYFEEGNVAVWLPELAVGAEGQDLDAAQEALLAAVIDYASSWEEELGRSPNHAHRAGWVYRVQLAGTTDQIRRILFEDHEAADLRRAPSLL